jgi:hypothetical protein
VRGLHELGWDGASVATLRASGDTYFESRVALGVRWTTDDGDAIASRDLRPASSTAEGRCGSIEISSDQVFQMMFMVGPLAPTHCLMLSLFFGVIPHDTSLHDLKDESGRSRALEHAEVPVEADPDLEQFAHFLRMLALAARLDVPVLIDG